MLGVSLVQTHTYTFAGLKYSRNCIKSTNASIIWFHVDLQAEAEARAKAEAEAKAKVLQGCARSVTRPDTHTHAHTRTFGFK